MFFNLFSLLSADVRQKKHQNIRPFGSVDLSA